MADYKTIRGTATFEYEEKRSRFIATASFADTEEKALAVLNAVRAANRTARHNVYAYVLQNGRTRYSDDGEPAKTAGTPALEVLQHSGLTDLIVVVTRYFGGILLGSGGLVRAYSKAAALALEAAGRARMAEWRLVEVSCGYPQFERVRRLLADFGAQEQNSAFGAQVELAALLPIESAETFAGRLVDVTAGSALCRLGGSVFRPQKIFSEK